MRNDNIAQYDKLTLKVLFQVYGINHLEGSIVVNLGVLIASPLNFITSTIGATLGTLMGVAFLSTSASNGTGNFQEVCLVRVT